MDKKRILIIDEYGFSRICSALLANVGYEVTITEFSDLSLSMNTRNFDLIVMSYPYCSPVFDEIGKGRTPILILADNFDEALIQKLHAFDSCYCMIKPLDYGKFRSLVKEVMSSGLPMHGGYSIV
jgi:hypothetical protein